MGTATLGLDMDSSHKLPSRAPRYFTFALLGFLASFLLLPSSKAVNNFFYAFLALPGLLLIISARVPRFRVTLLVGLWTLFFSWLALRAVWGGDGDFFKYLFFNALFCLIIWLWVDWRRLDDVALFQVFFWALIFYVTGAALLYWWTGQVEVGVRVLALPSRLQGPILTSILIVSCFALVLPEYLRKRNWWALLAAVVGIIFCVGFVLQSRSGLVGLVALLAFACGKLVCEGSWRSRAGAIAAVVLLGWIGSLSLQHSEVAVQLIARADSGRFELWGQYFQLWRECGLMFGCGPSFSPDIRIQGGLLIQHPHNIFLAMGFRYGLLGLLLFAVTMLLTLQKAREQRSAWGGYLLIALAMLNFDGRELINSPHEVWLLIWVPAMLIAAREQRP